MLGIKTLEEKDSKYNGKLKVIRAFGWGTYIQAEGLTQSGGIVTSMWNSVIKKIKAKNIKNVLILGLGGGTLVGIIKKYWNEAKITGVDIDPLIVSLGKKYLKLKDSDVKITIADAGSFVRSVSKSGKYDLIIVDLYNGMDFPKKFESASFLELLRRNLGGTGVVIFNRLYFKEKIREADKFSRVLKKIFSKVEIYKPMVNIMFICSR